eukprot:g13895.t1
MPEFPHEERKVCDNEAESEVPGREPSTRPTPPRAEAKSDEPVELGFEYEVDDDDPVGGDDGYDVRGLGISEEDLAEADNYVIDQLNQDLSRAEELEELLEDAQKKVLHLNRIVEEGRDERRARREAQATVRELQEERDSARSKSEQALQAAREAHALAIEEAQHHIEKVENANAQIILEAQQQVERAVAASLTDERETERERGVTEQKLDQLLAEVRNMKNQTEAAIHSAARSHETTSLARQDAHQARQDASQARQEATQARQDASQARQEATEAKAQAQVPTRGATPRRLARNSLSAVKWVRVEHEGGPLVTNEQARNALEGARGDQVVNVLTIFGAARQGKSFLMNALAGVDDIFPVSPEAVACTAGADLSPTLMALPDFERGGGVPAHPTSGSPHPKIAFVDMEGQGDKSAEHSIRLATPFLIVSKVVIFNWRGLPNKQTMLQELVLMIKAAEKVLPGDRDAEPAFGHLIILMRDVDMDAASIEEIVLKKERTRGLKHVEKKNMEERNLIREGLNEAFSSIAVHTMPSPHHEIEVWIINDSPRSVLEAIDTQRANTEVQNALAAFDGMLESTLAGDLVLSIRETNDLIEGARISALDAFNEGTQGISVNVADKKREELTNQLSNHGEGIARNQGAKRHLLESEIRDIVCASETDVSEQARSLECPMDEADLQQKWSQIVEQTFETLDNAIKAKVTRKTDRTGEDFFCDDLLNDLEWAISRGKLERFVKDTYDFVQKLNDAAISSEHERQAKEEALKAENDAAERAVRAQKEGQERLADAQEVYDAAARAHEDAVRYAQQARDDAVAASEGDRKARQEAEEKMERLARHAEAIQEETNRVMKNFEQVQAEAARAQRAAAQEAEQARNDAKVAAEAERESRGGLKKIIQQLTEQAEMFKKQGEDARREAEEARKEAAQIQARATRAAVSVHNQNACGGGYGYPAGCYGGGGRVRNQVASCGGGGRRPLTSWQLFVQRNAGRGWSPQKMSKEYRKK